MSTGPLLQIYLRSVNNCAPESILFALTEWLTMLTSLFLELELLLRLLWAKIKPWTCSDFLLQGERMTASYQLMLAYYPAQEKWNSIAFYVKASGKHSLSELSTRLMTSSSFTKGPHNWDFPSPALFWYRERGCQGSSGCRWAPGLGTLERCKFLFVLEEYPRNIGGSCKDFSFVWELVSIEPNSAGILVRTGALLWFLEFPVSGWAAAIRTKLLMVFYPVWTPFQYKPEIKLRRWKTETKNRRGRDWPGRLIPANRARRCIIVVDIRNRSKEGEELRRPWVPAPYLLLMPKVESAKRFPSSVEYNGISLKVLPALTEHIPRAWAFHSENA